MQQSTVPSSTNTPAVTTPVTAASSDARRSKEYTPSRSPGVGPKYHVAV